MQTAYRHCENVTRAADKDRFLAALFAPAERRGALFALYAFNSEIAGVRERAREPMPGEIRLQWWRDVLNGERPFEAAANPTAAALLDTVAQFKLPAEPLLALIEARAFDLYDGPMPTLDALKAYAHKTSVFEHAARILGGDHPAIAAAADHASIAYAITGLLRAFARHASRHQIYVPTDVLSRHGARAEDILAGCGTPALGAALAELRAHVRDHLAAFEALLPELPAATAPAFLPVALVPGYLAAMERSGYDPFKTVADVAQWRRQWALWRAARRYSVLMGR
jgi:phytoene synthase